MSEGDYFTAFDQSSGYRHIKKRPEYRKCLGVDWTFEGGSSKYFQFCVLLFSLSFLQRGMGIKAILYIDGGIAASRSFELAKTAAELVKTI